MWNIGPVINDCLWTNHNCAVNLINIGIHYSGVVISQSECLDFSIPPKNNI